MHQNDANVIAFVLVKLQNWRIKLLIWNVVCFHDEASRRRSPSILEFADFGELSCSLFEVRPRQLSLQSVLESPKSKQKVSTRWPASLIFRLWAWSDQNSVRSDLTPNQTCDSNLFRWSLSPATWTLLTPWSILPSDPHLRSRGS